MKLPTLALICLLSSTAFAADPCPKNAKLSDQFFRENKISIYFPKARKLSGTRLTFIGKKNFVKTYLNVEVLMNFSHIDGAQEIPAGTTLEVDHTYHVPSDDGYLASLDWMVFKENKLGIFDLKANYQSYSDLTVRRLQNRLEVTLLCEKR